MMQCSPTFAVVYISLLTMTAGFVLTLSSWFAPPINSFVHSVRIIGPATLVAGVAFMLLSCLICAVKQGKCCALCYYFILKDKFGPQFTSEDVETSLPLQTKRDMFLKRKQQKSIDEISVSSCKLGKYRVVSNTDKDKSRTLRATSLTELGKTSSPRKKMKGYRQLLEEDTMSLSDSHLAGACTYENGGKRLHSSLLNKISSKHKNPRITALLQQGEVFRCDSNDLAGVERQSFVDHSDFTKMDQSGSEPPSRRMTGLPEDIRTLTSLGNVSQCMCNCVDTSQVGQSSGGPSIVHSCQDINNLFHLGNNQARAIQSSTIDDLTPLAGMKSTQLI